MVVVKETLIATAQLMNVLLVVAHIREWSTLTVRVACKHAVTLVYNVEALVLQAVCVLMGLY